MFSLVEQNFFLTERIGGLRVSFLVTEQNIHQTLPPDLPTSIYENLPSKVLQWQIMFPGDGKKTDWHYDFYIPSPVLQIPQIFMFVWKWSLKFSSSSITSYAMNM